MDTAIDLRKNNMNIVVCGGPVAENRRVAKLIETAVGPWKMQEPHVSRAGPLALPHFQQIAPDRFGHSFYETALRKARVRT
jgi:hypothetical protein